MGDFDMKGMFQSPCFVEKNDEPDDQKQGDHRWTMNMENDDDDDDLTTTSESSIGDYSRSNSQGSTSSSSDLIDDASSNSSTNRNGGGPLYELSELMAQLPIKRGLSKYFQGKSQSFTSLSSVKNIQELSKKESPYYRKIKMKACKSYGGGLGDAHKLYTLPARATISKKASRNSISSLCFHGRRSSFSTGRPPLIPVQKNFSSVQGPLGFTSMLHD